jgi:hypothetical protein
MNEEPPYELIDKNKDEPQNFVVVLAFTSTDGETEEEFAKMVNDFKALYSLRENSRAYACVEESAQKVLDIVEKSD